ncbi:MAG: DUF4118 domain-containing protein, partial [Methylobacter sp.]
MERAKLEVHIKHFFSNAYIASILGTAAILFLLKHFQFIFGRSSPLLLFLVVIAFASWRGGFRTGLFITVLSAAAGDYFLVEPYGSFYIAQTSEMLRLA